MRKIPQELENPIDNFLINVSEFLSEYFNKIGFTPNGLTTLSLIFSLYSMKLYIDGDYELSASMHLISYFFDCFDGFYARKYNMISNFGDMYDHITDLITVFGMSYLVFKKYWYAKGLVRYLPFTLILSGFFTISHLGCQEIYNNDTKIGNAFLNTVKGLCPRKLQVGSVMKYTRYFATGTFNLILIFLIYYSKFI